MHNADKADMARWAADREAEAFRAIVVRYSGMVHGTCMRILTNAADAEDATQECFKALVVARRPPRGYVGPWLHRVATRLCLNRVRDEARRRERERRFASERGAATEPQWDDIEIYVDEAIAELPEKLRAPLVAHFLENRSHAAIAQALGIPRRTVTHRIGKGVERIGESLKKRGVLVTAAALTSMLSANLTEAASAPATLAAALGKLALAHSASAASAGSRAACSEGKSAIAKTAIAAAVTIVLVVGGLWIAWHSMREKSGGSLNQQRERIGAAGSDAATQNESEQALGGFAAAEGDKTVSAHGDAVRGDNIQQATTEAASDEQGGTITGQVIDVNSGEPVACVVVLARSAALSQWIRDSLEQTGILGQVFYAASMEVTDASGKQFKIGSNPTASENVITIEIADPSVEVHQVTSAPTDSDGRFCINGVPQGSSELGIEAGAWLLAETPASVEVAANGEVAVGPIFVALGGVVKGRVFDAETRQGIAGVAVETRPEGGGLAIYGGLTDISGHYEISGLPAGLHHVERGNVKGYQRFLEDDEYAVLVRLGGVVENIDFALSRGIRLAGRAVTERGAPLAGASLRCSMPECWPDDELFLCSGSDGRFEFRLPEGAGVWVHATKGELTSDLVGPLIPVTGKDEVVLSLYPGASIMGNVVDDQGRPMPQMVVLAVRDEDLYWYPPPGRVSIADECGAFALRGLIPGAQSLALAGTLQDLIDCEFGAAPPPEFAALLNPDGSIDSVREQKLLSMAYGYEDESMRVTLAPRETRTGIELVYADDEVGDEDDWGQLTISGHILDEEGASVRAVTVQAWAMPNERGTMGAWSTGMWGLALSDGSYTIPGLYEGAYRVRASAPGFLDHDPIVVAAGSENADIVLQKGAVIEGHVVNADTGRPVTAFQLEYRLDPDIDLPVDEETVGRSWPAAGSDAFKHPEGAFALRGLGAGRVTITAQADGYLMRWIDVAQVEPGKTTTGIVIRLAPAAPVTGTVVDTAGQPISGVEIHLEADDDDSYDEPVAWTQMDGAFEIRRIPAEQFTVIARKPPYAETSVPAESGASGTPPLRIVMQEGGTVTGTVTRAGEPAASYTRIAVVAKDDPGHAVIAEVNEDGTYTVQGVPTGAVNVRAGIGVAFDEDLEDLVSGEELTREAIVEAGETTVVDFSFPKGAASVEGVVQLNGQGVAKGYVTVQVDDVATGSAFLKRQSIEPGGYYLLEELPAGPAQVTVVAGAPAKPTFSKGMRLVLGAGETAACNIELTDEDAAEIPAPDAVWRAFADTPLPLE
ncbi:MAG TPA: sigma-70 family RNA polymerase sigma factor [Candidatus Hydrogenedentes bacterium]|nr:sigma-70 family RNA polymerase sigma factor [Candidatus Hydrogenedentota bacterium]HIJ73751.1 sigma-70 family RNA polymerase sigma factor [Candidatus Hydrogenedentota bacterium]